MMSTRYYVIAQLTSQGSSESFHTFQTISNGFKLKAKQPVNSISSMLLGSTSIIIALSKGPTVYGTEIISMVLS